MAVKFYETSAEAVDCIFDGAVIMFGGFGVAGMPINLINALRDRGTRNLTCIANGVGVSNRLDVLAETGQMRKFVGSFPIYPSTESIAHFEQQLRAGDVELEMVPQGTFAERIRMAGAGLGGFFTPTGVGTLVAEGKEKRDFDGRECLLELPLRADFALIKAHQADRLGNLIYRGAARNFSPVMAAAATVVIVEVDEIVETGELDPERIVTPGIYVDRIVRATKVLDK